MQSLAPPQLHPPLVLPCSPSHPSAAASVPQEDDNIVLVLEHATHGDLYGALRSTGTTLTEPQAVRYNSQPPGVHLSTHPTGQGPPSRPMFIACC